MLGDSGQNAATLLDNSDVESLKSEASARFMTHDSSKQATAAAAEVAFAFFINIFPYTCTIWLYAVSRPLFAEAVPLCAVPVLLRAVHVRLCAEAVPLCAVPVLLRAVPLCAEAVPRCAVSRCSRCLAQASRRRHGLSSPSVSFPPTTATTTPSPSSCSALTKNMK